MLRFGDADRSAIYAQLDQELTEDQLDDIVPARVVNMHRARNLPLLGIALAAALGTITLTYVIVAGARTHRRELAVLRAIGLEPTRVRRVLVWQGTLTALVIAAIGLPLSLITGAALWRHVADDTGVQPGSVVPPAIFLVVPAALVLAVLAALFTDLRVRHSRVADALRGE
jgi:putative ABC transport system permease protein